MLNIQGHLSRGGLPSVPSVLVSSVSELSGVSASLPPGGTLSLWGSLLLDSFPRIQQCFARSFGGQAEKAGKWAPRARVMG